MTAAAMGATLSIQPAAAVELGFPVACSIGGACFIQQYPDMDPGPGAVDPFCGAATYDGHDGTDFRLLSMADMERGVPVLAMADGVVLRLRDGERDRLVMSEADRAEVGSRECGNGLLIDHGDGLEVQYCHLRQGSLAVAPGDRVTRGDTVGQVGASGLAQFPHVHVTVRQNGATVDPSTGKAIGSACAADAPTSRSLFSPAVRDRFGQGETQLLSLGLAGALVDHPNLVVAGPPPVATTASEALVGWGWVANLRAGDRLWLRVTGPSGDAFASATTEPMDRSKASYSAFAGKKGAPAPGGYSLEVKLLRGEETVWTKTERYEIR